MKDECNFPLKLEQRQVRFNRQRITLFDRLSSIRTTFLDGTAIVVKILNNYNFVLRFRLDSPLKPLS